MNQPSVSGEPLSSSPSRSVTVAVPPEISTIATPPSFGSVCEWYSGSEASELSTYTEKLTPDRLALIISSRSRPSGRSADESLTA